jgi:electron transport complex protein RnfD
MPEQNTDARRIMLVVAGCLIPGLALQAVLIDPIGVLLNVLTAGVVALTTERLCLRLRNPEGLQGKATIRPEPTVSDASALVTGLILAAALPPGAVSAVALATLTALALGKHAYGGLGNNVFNPAMVGYAIALISLPISTANWPAGSSASTDALSGATVLTTFKYRGAATVDGIWTEASGFGQLAGAGYEWVALAFGIGGAVLFIRGYAAWRPAAGMLIALVLAALAGYDNGSSASLGSPAYHLFAGGTLLAATFVLTDPVSHPASHRGQWVFGLTVGLLVYGIRAWGNYPDGIAFAVLLGNALTPYLDRRLPTAESTRA